MKNIRAVLAGCGSISNAWLGSENVKRHARIVGLVDLRPETAVAQKEKHGLDGAETGADLDAMLRRVRPDVVFDCTVPEAHCAVTLTALRHGCHVLGEKPMSDAMPAARRMLAAAEKARRIYAVMQNRRYLPDIRVLRRFIAAGGIGRLVAVHSDFFIGAHFGGFRDVMEHVLLLDMAIHSFDQARFLSGEDPRRVYCHEWTPRHSWYRHGPSAAAIFEMTGDVVYTYQGSWCAEGCPTSWECAWRLIGEKGTVVWDGGSGLRCQVVSGKDGFFRPVKDVTIPGHCPKHLTGGHNGAIGAFLRAVRGGPAPETLCTDNIKSLAMAHAAVRSAVAGKRIPIS